MVPIALDVAKARDQAANAIAICADCRCARIALGVAGL